MVASLAEVGAVLLGPGGGLGGQLGRRKLFQGNCHVNGSVITCAILEYIFY